MIETRPMQHHNLGPLKVDVAFSVQTLNHENLCSSQHTQLSVGPPAFRPFSRWEGCPFKILETRVTNAIRGTTMRSHVRGIKEDASNIKKKCCGCLSSLIRTFYQILSFE